MELGQKLKQARLEAGLSQRQVCGEKLTRNMLSLIENGSARPSMDTLVFLASRLGRPMSWFLEEQTVTSPNQAVMELARQSGPQQALQHLKEYQCPDPVFDRERWLLEALSCLELAQQAIADRRLEYARSLLEQAEAAGRHTPYYTKDLERRWLLLCAQVGMEAKELVSKLPDNSQELLLRAKAAGPEEALALLNAAPTKTAQWHRQYADVLFTCQRYAEAAPHYKLAMELDPKGICRQLEACFSAMEDYKMAYFYACKQRQQ